MEEQFIKSNNVFALPIVFCIDMKNRLLYITILCLSLFSARLHAQGFQRKVSLRDPLFLDTASVVFHEIYDFWHQYEYASFLDYGKISDPDYKPKNFAFWADFEINSYGNPNSIFQSNLLPFYIYEEYFMGVTKRNDTLYELQTAFFDDFSLPKQLLGIYTIPLIKTADGFKLVNKLTINKNNFCKKQIGMITYYYPTTYVFDEEAANTAVSRLTAFAEEFWGEKFAEEFWGEKMEPVEYYLFENKTEMFHNFGIDGNCQDFYSAETVIPYGNSKIGKNKICYTKGGESKIHEFIHLILRSVSNGQRFSWFEEGVCCYFGEHVLQAKEWHFDKLKVFLNDNPQIDLSVDLIEAYVDADGRYTHDSTQSVINYKKAYCDVYSNYSYVIQMVICEMLYQKGGMELVKRMLFETPDDKALHASIERLLGIKRQEIDSAIKLWLNNHY
ncbi:MAG: hypothetical protein IKZ55_05875 [Bacteroidales bacterium]|nr:hypothetical protein [Bacteroidales bacterium]